MENTFHFSTVFMAIFTSNILLMIVAAIICNEKILINAGYKLISIFLVLIAVRFMLPIQFPFVTTFPLPQGISKIIIEFFAPRFQIGDFEISIYHIVLIIWIIGIIVQTYRFIRTDRMIKRFIFTFGKNVTKNPRYVSILNQIYKGRIPIRIFEVSGISTPFLYGFATPYILVPSGQILSDKMLTYILKHEVMHHKHNDLWLKFGVQLLSILCWWNPFGSLLNNHMDLVIEMRIDDDVTDQNNNTTLEYLACLKSMAEYQDTILNHKMGNVISFARCNETKLTRRFAMLMERDTKKSKCYNIILIFLVFFIYFFSYLFIFEAYYFTEEAQETAFQINEMNSYIVDNEDGTYDLYLGNIRIEVLDSLEHHDKDIPVYTKELPV